MGIPSYFAYVVRNHANILQKAMDITRNNVVFHRLYMDCNSILYDCYRDLTDSNSTVPFTEENLLKQTIEKIEFILKKYAHYIQYISHSMALLLMQKWNNNVPGVIDPHMNQLYSLLTEIRLKNHLLLPVHSLLEHHL